MLNRAAYIEELNYARDYRVRAGRRSAFDDFNERSMTGFIEVYDAESGESLMVEVPCVYGVCPTCDGRGSHVNPSIDCGGLTAEDFAEDPDFAEDYFCGRYDEPCRECWGRRVVPVPAEDCPKDTLTALRDRESETASCDAVRLAEMRMGA